MYLYNGEYGVATDENGLYYMRARYYNSEIKRFVNQDVLIGTISDSPTMNRYAYVNGNPISLSDPFGLSPSINWNALGHTALSFLGLLTLIPTPVTFAIGAVANIVNAAWYATEGNYFAAVCSAVGVFGGGFNLLSTVGSKSCLLMNVLKFGTAFGSIGIGGYDIYQIGYENYQSYVVRGEDFSLTDAVMDAGRIVLDSVAIAGGIKLLSEPVPSCFVAGTLVATADGHVAIEEIQAGDMVLAGDPETGEVAYKEVTRTFVNESDELIHVRTNGEEIITTPTHPFYVTQFGWTHAADLRAGDVLVLSNGEYVVVEFVQHQILESPVEVYNFEVEDFHTYFVGEVSVLVHNMCTPKKSNDSVQEINNKFPDDGQVGRQFDYTIDNGRIHIENGIQNADFIIDMDGNLKLGRGHSYLANGGNVQAAGTIKVNSQGRIRLITNESGHFQPTVSEALNYPTAFGNIGLDVNNSWIRIGEFTTSKSNYVIDSRIYYNGPVQYIPY